MSNASLLLFRTTAFAVSLVLCTSLGCSGSSSDTPTGDPAAVPSGVFTYHNDNARTGQNLQEAILTPANVDPTKFGKLFSYPVDGQVYAQPLYMPNVNIGGQLHNVVFAATAHDSVYAFDADNPASPPLWQRSFINLPGVTSVPSSDYACNEIRPEMGIISTPVIDPASGTLYVVAMTKENGTYVFRLHALNVNTGADKIGTGVVIQASVPGTGDGNDGQGHVPFNAFQHKQRAALLLSHGRVYVGFAGNCDADPYHGWLFGYDANSLALLATFNDTPNGGRGGIWNGGPSADADGNLFVITGNGTFDGNKNWGDSFLRLAGNALTVLDSFTPFNQANLAAQDLDLGSSAPVLLPDQPGLHPHLLVGGGKEGRIYLVNRDSMGQFQAGNDSQIVQEVTGQLAFDPSEGSLFTVPAYFNNTLYFLANTDVLKAFPLINGQLSSVSQATTHFGYPGASLAISANGTENGIVWALERNVPAVLHAYSAANVANELYNSNMNPVRDTLGGIVGFTVPTVANGKVYVGTQNELSVFGLLP